MVAAVGEWVSTRQISCCILCSESAPSFCLDSLQSRTGCYLSWAFYIVWTKEHRYSSAKRIGWRKVRLGLSAISSQIACHLDNYVIYLSVRHWTLVDSNVHHNTTKIWVESELWKQPIFLSKQIFSDNCICSILAAQIIPKYKKPKMLRYSNFTRCMYYVT